MKKMLALLTCLFMVLGASSAFALQSVEDVMAGDPVDVTLVTVMGSSSTVRESVYEIINEKLLETCNARLKIVYLDDADTQYPLLFAADDDFDLVFSCDWWHYDEYARKNAFMELTPEMIETYMPQNWASMPAEAWEQAKINDKIFLIPGNDVVVAAHALLIRGDLREKYGMGPLASGDDLIEYMMNVAEKETELRAVAGEMGMQIGYLFGLYAPDNIRLATDVLNVDYKNDDTTVYNILDSDWFLQGAETTRKLYEAGAWSSDALNSSAYASDAYTLGSSATYVHNLSTVASTLKNSNEDYPEFKSEMYDLQPEKQKSMTLYTGSGTAVNIKSKNPERALMVLDMMMNDQALYDLANYGIEGVHWEQVGDFYSRELNNALPEDERYSGSTETWCYYNQNLKRTQVGTLEQYLEMDVRYRANPIDTELTLFKFDPSKVEGEVAAVGNVCDQYLKPIQFGMKGDVATAIEEAKTMLSIAGIEAIQNELQRQLDEFWAARR